MSEKYFQKFPLISYANTYALNITERTKILNSTFAYAGNYNLYDISNNERPDIIADRYYNDSYLSWILYMSNNITDPYYDWYMDQTTFENFITLKYGSIQAATTKISYYRNNWYENLNSYSISYYNSLTSELQQFYEPILPDNIYATDVISYRRKRIDWNISTNSIVNYSVANSSFKNNEIVNVYFDVNHQGSGQVCFANSSSISIQHVQNYTSGITITGSSYIYGTESQTNTAFTTATVLINNINLNQQTYWSPVYYYDIEQEKNENNKSIVVLNKNYSSTMASQLKRLLS